MPQVFELADRLWTPQRRGVQQAIDLLSAGFDVCLYSPTGGGKTEQSMELFRWADYLGWPGCFYVNRKLLVGQTSARFAAAGIDHGIRAADYEDKYRLHAPFQICSADTERSRVIERNIWNLHESGIVVVDEAHIQKTDTMRELLEQHRQRGARIVLLTATPIGLSQWADKLVISGRLQEYRDCGALVPAVVRTIEQPDLSKVKRNATGEFVIDGRKRKIYTQSIVGSVIDRWKKYNPDARPAMLYAPGKPESVWFTSEFEKIGVPWCHVDATEAVLDGKRYTLNRPLWEDILGRYKDGSIKGISNRFKCLDMKTEVLAQRGWVGHDSLTAYDRVATMNLETGEVEWQRPLTFVTQCHTGQFCVAKNESLDIRVTDDHTLIVRSADRRCRSWKRELARVAADRRGAFQIPIAANWSDAEGSALSDHQIGVVGWMLTDGHIRKDTGGLTICQSMSQPDYIHQHIVDSLNGSGLCWTVGEYETFLNGKQYANHRQYRVSRDELLRTGIHEYMDKDLSHLLFSMTRRQLEVMLVAINYADGSKRKNPSWNVQTLEITKGNKTFLDRLQALCVTRGMRANLHDRQDGCWTLYVTPGRDYACLRGSTQNDESGKQRVRLVSELPDKIEPVWCIGVPNGTIITRRNGKVAVLGNCREGIDVPAAYHCILATPIGSLASYIQTVGRVLRAAPGKDHALITDHGGNYLRHGSPNHDRDWASWWTLPEHAISQMHTDAIRDGKTPEPIRCPKCEGERTGGRKCPHCGFEHEKSKRHVLMEDGRLVEKEGKLIAPRRVLQKPDTADLWAKMFWGFRRNTTRTFAQLYAFFNHEYHYYPPRDLPLMPKTDGDWLRPVAKVAMGDLHPKAPQNQAT